MTTSLQLFTMVLAAATTAFLWAMESVRPFFKRTHNRWRHAGKNFICAFIGVAVTTTLGALNLSALSSAEPYWSGVKMLGLPFWIQTLVMLTLFDAWMYAWHRLNHKVPTLWRFHRLHHSDAEMDVTTAFRFHPLELAMSELARFPVMFFLGMGAFELALYNLILIPVIEFHHSNVALPRPIDAALSNVIASPNMHRVHHSEIQAETDSNFGGVFSWWDKLFGTFRESSAPEKITLGIQIDDSKLVQPNINSSLCP